MTLATGIPEDVVRSANLNYRDPATVDLAAFEGSLRLIVSEPSGCPVTRE